MLNAIMTPALIIGFDSAWTGNKSGAIVGVFKQGNGSYTFLGDPQIADFAAATIQIEAWQKEHRPATTLILIDQPIIVPNKHGQRPVENIVGSPVGKRYGGVMPANRNKKAMFGDSAPIRKFLKNFGVPFDPRGKPFNKLSGNCVIETYPVLALISMGWLLKDDHPNPRPTGRLPKYNPDRKTFCHADWQFVCKEAADAFEKMKLPCLKKWLDEANNNPLPVRRAERKQLQDRLDACLCLLVGLHLIEGKDFLFVGDMETGYMVVPYGKVLHDELKERCNQTDPKPLGQFNIS